ncbi:hypothetical protein CMK11_18210 [Candidatus Poribacteria bacterium]|nr:hypothetical protein [Candidatus Poribacteria bacterium]
MNSAPDRPDDRAASHGETVQAGGLPDWKVADLPAPPPYRFGGAFRAVLGPGIIMLGASIGSGEWLLGPALTARYGGSLLWIATLAVPLQMLVNTEATRYTIYTGEPIFSGFMRCKPGSRFWAFFYLGIDVIGMWPAWAATAATALAAVLLGKMPTAENEGLVRSLAYMTFFACLFICLFGGKVYNALEKGELLMVVWIIGYLVLIDLFLVPPRVWWTTLKGFLSFGQLPKGDAGVDWLLLGAFAAYAGSGGLGNLMVSNYARDKGWGMSSLVGSIPSLIGGKNVTLSHSGAVFPITERNVSRFREWWKYNRFEQYYIWMGGCFLGLALPAMLTLAFVPAGQVIDQWSAAAFQAEGIAATTGRPIFWHLTLICGFWVLFSTQLAAVDSVPRRYTDIIWTGFASARRLREADAKWIYYGVLTVYVLWGVVALYLAPPFLMILVSATIAGYILVITPLHLLYVNRRFLPKEIRPPMWRQVGLVLCSLFYGWFGTMTLIHRVILPLLAR